MSRAYVLALLAIAAGVAAIYIYITKIDAPEPPLEAKSGDIVFVEGYTLKAFFVKIFNGRYSAPVHVGIMVVHDGEIQVVHADPRSPEGKDNAGVIIENWASFVRRGTVHSGKIYRHVEADGEKIAYDAIDFAERKIPFDWKFDWSDRSALYCTEFIDQLFRLEGTDLLPGLTNRQKIIFPSDIAESKHLRFVSEF